ncbi:hypothetical protein COV04_01065 [Candidatus Uhrbacteria bacterium CG10_big_fil_rev_8_21_14_0_10_48_11]|uniref:Uncharacterized protein n=1 Tax=Candidatus Uhrbacteria bacterium CG10_big_fil_rev_8_21_14_0_10_48_11 TaxID=1975037 RepID=A0A2M8LF82_9BACT|nr:MAG: hypothetical protein COV04_01065 [Candidatus Uhrbacteria bacterium CG10_big_fil_rev_8_21_14_0_10_48_11]
MFAVSFLVAGSASAQMGMLGNYWQNTSAPSSTQNDEVKAALSAIYETQGVSDVNKIDCDKVSDSQFETLGDAYMGIMMPNETQHQAMDTMMGGEGSESLSQAHINMGRSYLGCWANYKGAPALSMPMMSGGSGVTGYGQGMTNGYAPNAYYGNGYGMMSGYGHPLFAGGYGYGAGHFVGMALWCIFALIGLVGSIVWVVRRFRKNQ